MASSIARACKLFLPRSSVYFYVPLLLLLLSILVQQSYAASAKLAFPSRKSHPFSTSLRRGSTVAPASSPEGGTYVSVVVASGWNKIAADLTVVPSNTTPGACVDLSTAAAGRLASCALLPLVHITWSSKTTSGSDPLSMCARIRFFHGAACSGASSTVEVNGGWRAATATTGLTGQSVLYELPFRGAKSLQCDIPGPNACNGVTCPKYGVCRLTGSTYACDCPLNTAVVGSECKAVDSCTSLQCPSNGACQLSNGVATCACNAGYILLGRRCVPEATCGCPSGSTCSNVSSVKTCVCPSNTSLLNTACMPSSDLTGAAFLDPHNGPRTALGLPSLTWNRKLASYAFVWAGHLTNFPLCGRLIHGGPGKGYGQNLALAGTRGYPNFPPAYGVNMWVAEGDHYSYALFDTTAGGAGCSTGNWADCGHYTQVVWGNTATLGCAIGACPSVSGNWQTWVCNYAPAGNFQGQYPY